MSGKKEKQKRLATGRTPEVIRGHREFENRMRDVIARRALKQVAARARRKHVIRTLATLALIVIGCTALIWVLG